MGSGEGHGIAALGHGKEAIEIHRLPGNRQLLKDATTGVVDQHDAQLSGELTAPEPTVGVMQQGQITGDQYQALPLLRDPSGQ